MTTTATKTARGRNRKSPGVPYQSNAEALKSNGKYSPMIAVLTERIQGCPGNPYWAAFDAMTELTGRNPWRWESHWPEIVQQAAIRERIRRGELTGWGCST